MKNQYSLLIATISIAGSSVWAQTPATPPAADALWARHTIDDSSKGADGVKLQDVNGDDRLDIVTGWEQGGVVRVYLQPDKAALKDPWRAITVGRLGDLEDAVFADLDGDGAVDVLSAAEGKTQKVAIHWAPAARADYTDEKAWTTAALPASEGVQWMFLVPAQLDGQHAPDVIAGAKGPAASIGWFEAPADPRDAAAWTYHKLIDAGWVMSILLQDMNGDGHQDIVYSDRNGAGKGLWWLENPGPGESLKQPWTRHKIGNQGGEFMFMSLADLDGDGRLEALATVKPNKILIYRQDGDNWTPTTIRTPEQAGSIKSVTAGDINLDGQTDLVFTCENAKAPKTGVMWLSHSGDPFKGEWTFHDIAGPAGIKYDYALLLDLDGDGDLDALTCEEYDKLGVFWYENPTRP